MKTITMTIIICLIFTFCTYAASTPITLLYSGSANGILPAVKKQ